MPFLSNIIIIILLHTYIKLINKISFLLTYYFILLFALTIIIYHILTIFIYRISYFLGKKQIFV